MSAGAEPRFILVNVDEHDAVPEGCCMRFKLAGEPRKVHRVRYEPADARESAEYVVSSPLGAPDGQERGGAWAAEVEDSSAGTSTLVYGGALGLRLRPVSGDGSTVAEPYLLLARDAVVEWE
jgi:hypothetical protein